jgi:vanillate O-demethylase monooxygenase subunit
MLGTRTLEEANPVMFASDVAAQRARRLLARLVADQSSPSPDNAPLQQLRRDVGRTCNPIQPVV